MAGAKGGPEKRFGTSTTILGKYTDKMGIPWKFLGNSLEIQWKLLGKHVGKMFFYVSAAGALFCHELCAFDF